MIIALFAMSVGACGPRPSRPVETNEQLPGDEPSINRPVEAAHAASIRATLHELAVGFESTDPPRAALERGRWADIPVAADWAAADTETAIVRQTLLDNVWRIELITVDERPCVLEVTRAPEPQVWQATARVGLFPDRPGNIALAERLLAAFADRMAQLGRKLQFVEDYSDQ